MEIIRQGDVILERISDSYRNQEYYSKEDSLCIKGETGHSHTMNVPVYHAYGTSYIVVDKPTELKHEEHQVLLIPEGVYMIRQVRDYQHGYRGD